MGFKLAGPCNVARNEFNYSFNEIENCDQPRPEA